MLYKLGDVAPKLADDTVWVAENATVIGNVDLKRQSSIWFNATLRGDNEIIEVGENSNIQDGAIIHTDPGAPCIVGKNVTVGHMAMLHGCKIGECSLVGIGATILNRSTIGKYCLVGAGSLITEGKQFEDGSMIMGSPARVVRQLTDDEKKMLEFSASIYVDNARRFASDLEKIG